VVGWGFGVCFVLVGQKNVGWLWGRVACVSDTQDSFSYVDLDLALGFTENTV
jgi:hypothetical protein